MPQVVTHAPSFSTRTPDILNSSNKLSLSIPVLNIGTAAANNMVVTGITLGSSVPLNPAMPVVLGDLGADNAAAVNASFSAANLTVGNKYLVTVRGTYAFGNATYGFAVNRFIVVPAPVAPPIPFLAAHVLVSVNLVASTWSYTVFNDESAGSHRFINAISIDMTVPFTVTGTPSGWAVDTDNFSYVLWYAVDVQLPYPHHIAPGASLSGFQIMTARSTSESKGLSITSWNHQTDQADLTALGDTLVPSQT
ncbi:MAG: hypothetical protein LAP87_25160 [Acidobacteriia bacterium]|nr:hypothetical protein [Terriglobia bacterium]